jgi:NitT/TauT family transport system permease protein
MKKYYFLSQIKTFLIGFALFNLLWYILAFIVDSSVLVHPIDVYSSLGIVFESEILSHILASLFRIIAGIMLSVLISIPIGLFLATYPKFNKIFSPLLYFSYPIPKLALLPIVMLLLGIGELSKITLLVLILVFQLIVSTRDAVFHIPSDDFDILISLGASRGQRIRWILLPAIVPEVLTSLRIAVGTAVSVLFFTETFGTDKGLGFFIVDSWMRLSYIEMYIGILVLAVMGLILFLIIDLLEKGIANKSLSNL